MQELVKRTLSVLIATVREEDVAIVSVESGEADMRDITGGGVSGGERITVALSVADAEGGRAENIAESMREDSFMLRVDALVRQRPVLYAHARRGATFAAYYLSVTCNLNRGTPSSLRRASARCGGTRGGTSRPR